MTGMRFAGFSARSASSNKPASSNLSDVMCACASTHLEE